MLTATHTHGAPATVALRNWGRPDETYQRQLQVLLVQAAVEAVRAAGTARLAVGTISCPGVAVNRSLKEEGTVNDQLGVMRIEDAAGRPLAVLLHFACHPVNLHSTGMITPDFPYYVEREIQAGLGGAVPVLYLAGAGGDLNPANFGPERSEARAAETGRHIARKALELLPRLAARPVERLACATRPFRVPLQPLPPREELLKVIEERSRKMAEEADKSPSNWAYCSHKTNIEWARDALQVLESGRQETEKTLELQGFLIGDAALVGAPGEPFAEFGAAVARSGLAPHAFLVGLANGCFGYFPSRKAYAKQTYEAVGCPKFIGLYLFGQDVGERLMEGCLALLEQLVKRGGARPSREEERA
jgi:hypothetical protein